MVAMTNVLLIGLFVAAMYLTHRWMGARAENVQLRQTIAQLKRQRDRR
jgi:hypothetical protein